MDSETVDILMITYNRPQYTELALSRLIKTCDETMRVWLWHNGDDEPTLEIVRSFSSHPRVFRFHHSHENKKLRDPTNWFWQNATGAYLSKVDDDCLLPDGWAHRLRQAHETVPELGVIGCWRFLDEDVIPELVEKKLRKLPSGYQLLQNFWVEGSGYLMKRSCLEAQGLLPAGRSFTHYCVDLALKGWVNGWLYPFIYQEHMDDPRTPHSLLKTDADIERWAPLSALRTKVKTVAEWEEQLRRSARITQEASIDPRDYTGWRWALRRIRAHSKRYLQRVRGR